MTAHGVLRPVLDGELARLTRTIKEYLGSGRRDSAEPPRFSDLGSINPALLLHRLWLADTRDDVQTALHEAHLRAVITACQNVPADLLRAVHARRAAAATALAARHAGWTWRSVLIEPMWRLVVGHGEDSVHETALTLSPTYGVPVLPGTALKGLAAATARFAGWSELDDTLFGTPRPGRPSDAHRGSVLIWDGVPTEPPELVLDVLTPHVKAYYDSANATGTPAAEPAEYHNPVPVRFLAVAQTSFRAYLLGPPRDVDRCVELISSGLGELGIGGKTAAGYGYAGAEEERP